MQREVLHKLGDYLLAHRDEIVGEWLRAIEQNRDMTAPTHLEYDELVDHLPEFCQELSELLKTTQPEESRSQIFGTARLHGKSRWRQGYRLEEVIREASILRRVLFYDWVHAFAQETPEFDGEARKVAERIVHQAVDDAVTVSAEEFVEEQQKSVSHLNSQLSDALAEVRKQKAEAEAANAAKDRFFAMLSHELRTPLNPILLWADGFLNEEQLDPTLRKDVEMVRRNVQLEVTLIDDLLDMARITGGKLQLHLQLSDAASLFRDVLEIVEAETRRKQLDVRVQFSATNHLVLVDPARLQQVFWNVVKNAQKFTPEGGIISIRSYNPTESRVVFEITDSGKGIEPDVLPSVFQAFEQGVAPTEGLGLGLAISKGIIEAHGGSIRASSKGAGTGATFTIELEGENHGQKSARVPS